MADSITAGGVIFPPLMDNAPLSMPVSFTSYAIPATAGSGIAFTGRMFIADRSASKLISSAGGLIYWLSGASSVTATTAVMSFGIMDVSATTGPPGQPDGTYDVSTTLTGSTGSRYPANSWITATMTSGAKTISHGELYSFVVRAVVSGGLRVRTPMGMAGGGQMAFTTSISATTIASTLVGGLPNALFQFDDGVLGWMMGSVPLSSVTSQSISSGGTNNEYGMRLVLPWSCQIDQLRTRVGGISTADYTVILYSDPNGTPTTVTAIAVLGDQQPTSVTGVQQCIPLQVPVSITASTTYLLAVRADAAVAITMQKCRVADAAYKIAFPAHGSVAVGARTGGVGAFSMDETLLACGFGVRVNQITGGGATTVTVTTTTTITVAGTGMLVHPSMTGGLRG